MTTTTIFKNEKVASHRQLADRIKEASVVTRGVITEKEGERTYDANLPEGITKEMIGKISAYNSDFTKATIVAVTEMAADFFIENTEAKTVTSSHGFFNEKDTIKLTVDRERSYPPAPKAESKDPVKKMMVVRTDHDYHGGSTSALRSAISEEFAGIFSK